MSFARSAAAGAALLAVVLPLGCTGGDDAPAERSLTTGAPITRDTREMFVDVAAEAGLAFTHFNGMSGEYYMAENVAPGAALFDYDGDGDLDVYLVQGALLGPGKSMADATFPWAGETPLRDRLFRNDLDPGPDGRPRPRFTDVTVASGIDVRDYGMGVAAGDADNDGDVDLYVTNFGPNRLLLNAGDGTFRDASGSSGTADPLWSVSAAFVDVDADGRLDLFVGNYLNYNFELDKDCISHTGVEDYCSPDSYSPLPDRLYRNAGDGRFEDLTRASGIAAERGAALGVIGADFDDDGRLDVYVANDGLPNFLWMNQGDGTFRNTGLLAGCALNRDGNEEASMGVDAADFDGDGDEDLFMAHLDGETNTLYVNDGTGIFEDRSLQTGVGPPSHSFTGFGAAWKDFDNDGRLDIFVANGAVKTILALADAGDPYPLRQRNQLFLQTESGNYRDASAEAGAALALTEVSRGAAFGDVDNDGDVDVLVANSAGPVRLLINQSSRDHRWIGLRVLQGSPARDALGARVGIHLSDGRTVWRRVRTDGSYASASDPRLLLALGSSDVRSVEVRWLDGSREEFVDVSAGAYNVLLEGSGRAR